MSVQTVKVQINGQEYSLTYSEAAQAWQAVITAPNETSWNEPNHTFPVTVTATDNAGNSTTVTPETPTIGEDLNLRVLEKVAPTIVIVSPSEGALLTTATPEIQFTVTDTGSGVDPSTISITIDSQAPITSGISMEESGGTYTCTYTPAALQDGDHTITINASDYDGNAATPTASTFTVDTVAPDLNVATPTEGLVTNQPTITVSGTTTPGSTVTVNGEAATVDGSSFTYQYTLSDGENTLTIIAADAAGNTTTVTRHVTLDTTPPTIVSVSIVPNPVDAGATFTITVNVTD